MSDRVGVRYCLKVDVDTHDGLRRGVPRLLDAFARAGVQASFFLSYGPDNAGKAIWNVVRQRGFLRKMLRTGAPKLYGWRTILSGTLLPARPIGLGLPELVRRIAAEGHEVGVHAWDHRLWQDHLPKLPRARVAEEVARACAAHAEILGEAPRAMAAPAWLMTPAALAAEDARDLLYASDMRGGSPGYPELDGYRARTLQIPTTQPCLEELLSLGCTDRGAWIDRLLARPCDAGENLVLPLHAEVEGGPYLPVLEELLERLRDDGAEVERLDAYAARLLAAASPPTPRAAELRPWPGRAGQVFAFARDGQGAGA